VAFVPSLTGIRSLFDRHWIKTGRLPVEVSQFYRDIFNHRQHGDYQELVSFARDDVEEWFVEAEKFVARLAEEIEKQIQGS
jgi:uncharacterized protein (UPF0332 family)